MKNFVAITPIWGEVTYEYGKSFDLFGITFAIHRPHGYDGRYYTVSEITTGMRALPSIERSIKMAESEARTFLEQKGEVAIRKAITKGKRMNTLIRKRLKEASK